MELENRIEALESAQRERPKIPFLVVYEYLDETVADAELREGVQPEDYDVVLNVRYRELNQC